MSHIFYVTDVEHGHCLCVVFDKLVAQESRLFETVVASARLCLVVSETREHALQTDGDNV